MNIKQICEIVLSTDVGQVYPKKFLKKKKKKQIKENLDLIKFTYTNFKHDKHPKVKVLDYEYPGQEGQKNYGKRKDVLGWNLNYFFNVKEAEQTIDQISNEINNKKEKYEAVKKNFPEQASLIRRYKKKHIIKPRKKGFFGFFTKNIDLS